MKTNIILLVFIISLVLFGCNKDQDLQKTIFYPDEEFPELPIYSEWGYNTFGAYLDRETFVSDNSKIPLKVIVENDITSFRISGTLGFYKEMVFIIKMNNFLPDTYMDLLELDQQYVELTNPEYEVVLIIEGEEYATEILNGGMEFKRAQNLNVDFESVEVILSGVFELQLIYNNEPVTFSEGRFDFGIGSDNFYKL